MGVSPINWIKLACLNLYRTRGSGNMAKIVLGVGTSHGPMISTPPDQWHLRAADDRQQTHPFREGTYSFDELAELRRDEGIAEQITLEVWQARHAACQTALA